MDTFKKWISKETNNDRKIIIWMLKLHFLCLVNMLVMFYIMDLQYWVSTNPLVEKMHLEFLKRIMNIRKSTNTVMVYFELGRCPMLCVLYKQRKLWNLKYISFLLEQRFTDAFIRSCFSVFEKSSKCVVYNEIVDKFC